MCPEQMEKCRYEQKFRNSFAFRFKTQSRFFFSCVCANNKDGGKKWDLCRGSRLGVNFAKKKVLYIINRNWSVSLFDCLEELLSKCTTFPFSYQKIFVLLLLYTSHEEDIKNIAQGDTLGKKYKNKYVNKPLLVLTLHAHDLLTSATITLSQPAFPRLFPISSFHAVTDVERISKTCTEEVW